MTSKSGGPPIDRGPAPEPDRQIAGDAGGKSEDPSPDDDDRGEASDSDPCTAHDRAS